MFAFPGSLSGVGFHCCVEMDVKISSFFVVFSGLIPSIFIISAEFLRKFWEGFEIGLGFVISQ